MKRKNRMSRRSKAFVLALSMYCLSYAIAYAQDGNAGISEAATQVRGYFDTGTQLMYAIGAVLGLVGAVKVYQKWNSGDPDTSKVPRIRISPTQMNMLIPAMYRIENNTSNTTKPTPRYPMY